MTVLIPPPRNLGLEGLDAFFASRQEARRQEEERERQEEAADAGGGGLGSGIGAGIGAIVGGIWNFGAGSAAGAAIGAGIGGGLGGAIGEAADPAGVNYGGSGAVAGRYLQAGTQQALQGLAMVERQTEVERREGVQATQARIAREARTLPPGIAESDFDAMLGAPFGPTGATVEESIGAAGLRAGLWEKARQQEQARRIETAIETRVGAVRGIQAAKAEIAQQEAFDKDPSAFELTPPQAELYKSLKATQAQWDDKLTQAQIAGDVGAEREARQVLRNTRLRQDALARSVRRRPPQPTTYPQLVASGQPGVPGRNYSFPHPQHGASRPIGAVSFADKGKPFFVPHPMNNLYKREGLEGWWELDENMQHKRPDPETTKKDAKAIGGLDIDIGKVYKEVGDIEVPIHDPQGRPIPGQTRPLNEEEIKEAARTRIVAMQDAQWLAERRQIVHESESANELFDRMAKGDPGFMQAMQVIQQPHRMTVRQVEEAARYIALRIRETVAGIDMPDTLREDLAKADAVLARVVATRKLPFGVTGGL